MFRVRSLSTTLLIASTLFGAAAAFVSPTVSAGEEKPCTNDNKFGPVIAACKSGKLNAAKNLMKDWEKKIEAKGGSFECKSCHSDQKTFPLKDNAKADFDAAKKKYPDIIK